MDKAPAILGLVFGIVIAILSLILLLTDYKDCFSKEFSKRNQMRSIYKRQWIFTLVICIMSFFLTISLTGYLIFSDWNFKDLPVINTFTK